ncbi:MAG: F0F1 ATP synthase subunit A [Clostridia bacterium]|nr:F0F1 ATP synthase subunit A [Clostridia bacterium]
MEKKKRIRSMVILFSIIIILFVLSLIAPGGAHEDVKDMMQDAVLHEVNKVAFLGMEVNPGLISAFVVSGILIVIAVILRIFAVPKFTTVPGKVQLVLEEIVGLFSGMAETNSHHRNRFLGAYITIAGTYIFVGTMFELLGIQVVTTEGLSISLSAPLSDINGAIAMGCLSYGVILAGGILANGTWGLGQTLKDFSLPISMSFRLFGALLSGALVTELVYYYSITSMVIPVVVGVLFTAIHALVQAYVLTTLVSIFYGEVTEHREKKPKVKKSKKMKNNDILTEGN